MQYLLNALLAIYVIVCLFIILLVLMQRPRNEGLGAAFGGGVTEGLFGTQTTHVLARLTRWLGGIFFVLTLVIGLLYSRKFATTTTSIEKRLSEAPVPAAPATPAPGTLPGATPATPDGGVVLPEVPAPGTPAPAPSGGVTPPTTPEGTPVTPAPGTTPAPEGAPAPGAPAPKAPAPGAPAPAAPSSAEPAPVPGAPAPVPAAPAPAAPAPPATTPVPAAPAPATPATPDATPAAPAPAPK